MDKRPHITQQELKNLFEYKDGKLIRKISVTYNAKVGDVVGNLDSKGYLMVYCKRRHYLVHRLIWLWHYGEIPQIVDHINRMSDDNRIENLRAATFTGNCHNTKLRKNNSTGHEGIHLRRDSGRFRVYFNTENKHTNIGTFITLDEAVKARRDWILQNVPLEKRKFISSFKETL